MQLGKGSRTSIQKQIPSGLFPRYPILSLFLIILLRHAGLFTGKFRVCTLVAEGLCRSVMGNCPVYPKRGQGQEQSLGGESRVLLPQS